MRSSQLVAAIFLLAAVPVTSYTTLRGEAKAESALESPGNADQVVGVMKGLMDGYVNEYRDKVAEFDRSSEGMDKVIEAARGDTEALSRAMDEKARMQTEHDNELQEIATKLRTAEEAVKALRPGNTWEASYQAKLDEIYAAHPSFLSKAAKVTKGSINH
mmetsp:Transcript_65895/g.157536  ORF Transcript_65895/g.157536 Transcript_65895/m.157536 type:complete len:160 (+) Transcript_65895:89-568(+)